LKRNLFTTEYFIERAKNVHGNRYDYSKVIYNGADTKTIIICPIHGEFKQTPAKHLFGQNCPVCSGNKKISTNEFIERAKNVHGNKYDYYKSKYVGAIKQTTIICPIHGEFKQRCSDHLKGKGCPQCVGKNKTIETYIDEANEVHKNKYDYSKTKLTLTRNKIIIICPIHGEFKQTANSHLRGNGCPRCSGNKKRNTNEFINEANEVHKNKYDYSKTKYINSTTKVTIICPHHGEFQSIPTLHLLHEVGCPSCSPKSKGEEIIKEILDKKNIKYRREKTFNGCKHKNKLRFDFYIPSLNICIEYDGIQHYKPIGEFGGLEAFKLCKLTDNIKNEFCENNKIRLYRIRYDDNINEKLNEICNIF